MSAGGKAKKLAGEQERRLGKASVKKTGSNWWPPASREMCDRLIVEFQVRGEFSKAEYKST